MTIKCFIFSGWTRRWTALPLEWVQGGHCAERLREWAYHWPIQVYWASRGRRADVPIRKRDLR